MMADEYDLFITESKQLFYAFFSCRAPLARWRRGKCWTVHRYCRTALCGAELDPTGIPPVQQAFKTFLEAGQAVMEWISAIGPIDGASIAALGLPNIIGSLAKAPFDTLGDTMRGTRAIMLDMYASPKN